MKMLLALMSTFFLLLLAVPLSAQRNESSTRSVQGVVTDGSDSPANGAVVQLKDTKSLQIRSFITKDNGSYHFNGLSPDVDYELKAEFNGTTSSSKTLSSFDGRKNAVVNIKVSK